MDHNGVIEIEILDNPNQKYVDIIFRDDGVGIPDEMLDDVMKPFFTTKEDGTGLGLALCDKLVSGSGGRLEIRARKPHGCEVIVSLPIK